MMRVLVSTTSFSFFCLGAALSTGCSGGGQLSIKSSEGKATYQSRENGDSGDSATSLSRLQISEQACQNYELSPESEVLSINDFKKHLNAQQITFSVQTERSDLHLFDLEIGETKVRLRVATLKTPRDAGRHLHLALLEHGQDYWGVHRANLAILGPPASISETLNFATETGLACWGVLTAAGRDDSFAIPGAYFEL